MRPEVWLGEGVRWYVTRAKHPFKNYVVGHYWRWLSRPRFWVKYDGQNTIGVQLGDYLQQRIFFDGYYERPLIDWLKKTLRPNDVFWDVGANIGAVSIVASGLCQQVVAFEPDPRSLESLSRNLEANSITNVEVIAGALGTESGTATLFQSATVNTGMTSLLSGRGEIVGQTDVLVIRADDLIAARPELTPTVMKVDVEGAEHLVLGGASRVLKSGSIRALVFEDRRGDDARPTNRDIIARLNEANYSIEPFAASDVHADDGMYNFLATPIADR